MDELMIAFIVLVVLIFYIFGNILWFLIMSKNAAEYDKKHWKEEREEQEKILSQIKKNKKEKKDGKVCKR